MPNTDRLTELKKQLLKEIERSILIEDEDKKYWLEQVETLPIDSIERLLGYIKPKNDKVDEYIDTALAQDKNQEHLKQLKRDVAQIKKTYFKAEEGGQKQQEEEKGEELLKQLEDL